MIVRVFYNKQAFENVLLVRLSDDKITSYHTQNKTTKLYNDKDEVVGYNLNVIYQSDVNGLQKMSKELLSMINKQIKEDFNEELTHDFTDYIVVGKVLSCKDHPDSDHLHVCEVDVGDETLQIVCGASNVCEGIKVVVARINAVMPNGLWIQPGKLRGVESDGMLCSEYELGLIKEKKKGIYILDEKYEVGKAFF